VTAGYRSSFEPDGAAGGATSPRRRGYAVAARDVRRERVKWLSPGRVPYQSVTVVAGIGGLGKSQWTLLLAAGNDGGTLIATAEDSPATTVRPRLEAVQANLDRVAFVTIQSDGFEEGVSIPDDIDILDELVVDWDANLLIVDPLVAHIPVEFDAHKDQSVRRALAPLYRLAVTRRIAVVAVMHLNKATGLAPLARLSGSGAFGNLARSVLLLDHDPDDPDGERGFRRVLAHVKCNLAPLAPSLLFEVEPIVLPAEADQPAADTSRLRLIGESPHTGRELLTERSDEEQSALEEAQEFLAGELGDGARHLAGEVIKAARAVGISDRTLRRARKGIGAESAKAGFTRGWEWWLPEGAKPVAETRIPPQSGQQNPTAASGGDDEIDELGRLPLDELWRRYG
jgi:hypothetical protein